MRRIKTQEEIEKRRKRTGWVVGIILLAILVFGTVGFGFLYNPGALSDGEVGAGGAVEGPTLDGRYAINFEGTPLIFTNSPNQVEEVLVEGTFDLNSYVGKRLYIDSNNQAMISEIVSTLGRFTGDIQRACYGGCEEDLPEKDCEGDNLIVWRDSLENKVYNEGKCAFIEGDLTATDAFLYDVFER